MTLYVGVPSRRSPLVRLHVEQLEIPMPVQARVSCETPKLHAALVELRHRGYVIYREGAYHRLDGFRLTSAQVWALMRALRKAGR